MDLTPEQEMMFERFYRENLHTRTMAESLLLGIPMCLSVLFKRIFPQRKQSNSWIQSMKGRE